MAKWITFKTPLQFEIGNCKSICVEGPQGELLVKELAEASKVEIESIKSLPYPAHPRLHTNEDSCPSFCHAPDSCAGHSSCPRNYACSE